MNRVGKPSVGSSPNNTSPNKKRKGQPDTMPPNNNNMPPTGYAPYPQHQHYPQQTPYGSQQPPQHPYGASPYPPQHPPSQPYPQSAYGGGGPPPQSQTGGYGSNPPPYRQQPPPSGGGGAPPNTQHPPGFTVAGGNPSTAPERQPGARQAGAGPWGNPADAYANSNASHPAPNSRSPSHAQRNAASPPPSNPGGGGGWHGQQYSQQPQHVRSQPPPSSRQQQQQHTPPSSNQQQNQPPREQNPQRPGYNHPPTHVWNTSSSPSQMEWGGDGSVGGSTPPTNRGSPNSGRNMMSGSPNEGSNGGMLLCEDVGPGGMTMKMKKEQEDREKGRGSYRCGKCGVPKKGHVCPYQPKFKRRPDEPAPETRNATTQVEMDEFLVLRRLNLEIQGFPESYTSDPANNVGAEPHHQRSNPSVPRTVVGGTMSVGGGRNGVPPGHEGMNPPVRSQMNHVGLGPGAVSPLGGAMQGMGMGGRPSGSSRRYSNDGRNGVLPPSDVPSSSHSVRNLDMEGDGSRVDRGT